MKKITKEKCVVCHKETIYDGVGQLCFECYDSLYRIKNKKIGDA